MGFNFGTRRCEQGYTLERDIFGWDVIALALACPGLDYIKLWPVQQPWQDTPDPLPDPWPGWYARR